MRTTMRVRRRSPLRVPCQVEVQISRKWRDMTVVLKYVRDEIEALPFETRAENVTVVAHHKALTSSGRTNCGAAELPGAEALYVGMTYRLAVVDTEHVSARSTEVLITPGSSPLRVELPVGPSAGRVKLRMRNGLRGAGYPLEALPLPPIVFTIQPLPRTGRAKATGTTCVDGRYVLTADAQLYVGRKYTLEVERESNGHLVEPAATEFTVLIGTQTVNLDVHRSVGNVRTIDQTRLLSQTVHAAASDSRSPALYLLRDMFTGVCCVHSCPHQHYALVLTT